MLEFLALSCFISLICTLIIVGVPIAIRRQADSKSVGYAILVFLIQIIPILISAFYLEIDDMWIRYGIQSIWFVILMMHIGFMGNFVIATIWDKKMEMIVIIILIVIRLLLIPSNLKNLDQTLVYIHDNPYRFLELQEIRKVKEENVLIDEGIFDEAYFPDQIVYTYTIKENKYKYAEKKIRLERRLKELDWIIYDKKKRIAKLIRKKYPTVILEDTKLDIDDNWNPYQVYAYREKLYTSNGQDYGIIVFNFKEETVEKYPASEGNAPAWVDFQSTYPR